jgi:hypothetical protein
LTRFTWASLHHLRIVRGIARVLIRMSHMERKTGAVWFSAPMLLIVAGVFEESFQRLLFLFILQFSFLIFSARGRRGGPGSPHGCIYGLRAHVSATANASLAQPSPAPYLLAAIDVCWAIVAELTLSTGNGQNRFLWPCFVTLREMQSPKS